MATEATSAADLRAQQVAEMQKSADAENEKRSGKGTRLRVGQTRGKNPQVITWEAFDESKPDTLPADLAEFVNLTGIKDEKAILEFLVDGFNSAQYTQASDPIAEYVEPTWPDEVQKQFRLVVRNFAAGANISIEQAVEAIKPSFAAAQKK